MKTSLTIVVCFAQLAVAQLTVQDVQVDKRGFHVITEPAGDPPLFIDQSDMGNVIQQYKLDDGSYIGILDITKPGIHWIDAVRNGAPGEIPKRVRRKVIVRTPPEPPTAQQTTNQLTAVEQVETVQLTYTAARIYQMAVPISRPAEAKRIAQTYRAAMHDLRQRQVATIPEAYRTISDRVRAMQPISREWQTTATTLTELIRKHNGSIRSIYRALDDIVSGMQACADGVNVMYDRIPQPQPVFRQKQRVPVYQPIMQQQGQPCPDGQCQPRQPWQPAGSG